MEDIGKFAEADIYTENGMLVINTTYVTYKNAHKGIFYKIEDGVITVRATKINSIYIDNELINFSDNLELLEQVKTEYIIESEKIKKTISFWKGSVIIEKFNSREIKEGWVELQDTPVNYKANNYLIIF